MANQAFKTWRCGANGPQTPEDLRETLTALAKKKRGTKLLSGNFLADNLFAGQSEDITQLATLLANTAALAADAVLIGAIDANAQKEVVNWIAHVPAKAFSYNGGVWTLSATGSMAKAMKAYEFATVDLAALAKIKPADFASKSEDWLTEFTKKPRIACRFGKDGTPLIYQMDF